MLNTGHIWIAKEKAYALFDTGATHSFITASLARQVGLPIVIVAVMTLIGA